MPFNFVNPGLRCGLLDLTNINSSEQISNGNIAWIGCTVDDKMYLHTPYTEIKAKPHVVITFDDPCYATICKEEIDAMRGMQWFFRNVMIQNAKQGQQDPNTSVTQPEKQSSLNEVEDTKKAAEQAGGKALDISSLNNFDFQPAAIYPSAAAIPMVSNISSYGPWASSNFNGTTNEGGFGGVQIERQTDLVPWNYGSLIILNDIANTLVENTNIGLVRQETGSFTAPGLPQNINLVGESIGTFGPSLTSINFTFGNQVTTSYEFRTYTPKFGKMSKLYIDKFKKIADKRREMIRFLRSQAVNQYKFIRKFQGARNPQLVNKLAVSRQASLQRVIASEMYDLLAVNNKPSQRTVTGVTTLDKSITEMMDDFNKKAFMSFDGFWGPVSLNGAGDLPRFAQFNPNLFRGPISKNPHPPFGLNNSNLPINRTYLNPLTNKVNNLTHYHTGDGTGHSIDMVGREDEIPEDGMLRSFYSVNDNKRYSNDYRFLAMRGPLVLHSWGYDTDGKPVPNESDDEDSTKTGQFTNANLKDKFLKDWLGKPATWPVAPIDLRFDRDRGVWVSPQSPRIITALLTSDLDPYSNGTAEIQLDETIYDSNGIAVNQAPITVLEKLGSCYKVGDMIHIYFNTAINQYIVLSGTHCHPIILPPPEPPYCASTSTNPYIPFQIGFIDMKTVNGWNATKQQVLTHDTNGCLEWVDTASCETTPTP